MSIPEREVNVERAMFGDLTLEAGPTTIAMKFSSVPSLLYILSKNYGTDYLTAAQREEIAASEGVSYVGCSTERFTNNIDHYIDFYTKVWDGVPGLDAERIKNLRTRTGADLVHEALERESLNPHAFVYLGCISPTPEYYPHHIHLLVSPDTTTYIVLTNIHNRETKILKASREGVRELCTDLVSTYGTPVSSGLKNLLS